MHLKREVVIGGKTDAVVLGLLLQLIDGGAQRGGVGLAGHLALGNRRHGPEGPGGPIDPSAQFLILILGRLDIVNLGIAWLLGFLGILRQLGIELFELLGLVGIVRPAQIDVIPRRAEQAKGEQGAHHEDKIAFDPAHNQ